MNTVNQLSKLGWCTGLALGLTVAAINASVAGAIVVAQVGGGGALGQEMRRLRENVQAPAMPAPDRQPPPEVISELEKRAAEVEAGAEDQVEVESEQIEQDAESILNEAESADADADSDSDSEEEEGDAHSEEPMEGAEHDGDVEHQDEDGDPEADTDSETDVDAEVTSEGREGVGETSAEEATPETETPSTPSTRSSRTRRGGSYSIDRLTVEGDGDLLDLLDLRTALEAEVVGKTLTDREITEIIRTYNRLLVEQGYYLSRVSTPPAAIRRRAEGELVLEVDQGRVGDTAFYQMDGEERVPFEGRWYSEKQLRRRLSGLESGAPFLYDDFYKSVFTVNSHPDLTMDTDLNVRREREENIQRRYVDMDFTVQERIPIHGVFELQNSGTDATEEWRMALTLQHLNLTKHDDVLTLTLPVSVDFSTVRSVAASYYLPHYYGNGGAFTLYGGYSELDTDDLVPDIDLLGEGYFWGFQGSYDLIESDRHILKGALGYAYQVIEDTLVLGDDLDTPRKVTIAPISVVLSYSSVRPDRMGGRNFLTSQTSFNFGGMLGSSDDDEITLQRQTAEADYWVERLQYARIQPLSFSEQDPEKQARQWILFGKLDGQLASGPLIPAEAKAVGGLDNVRGYREREVLGDHGISGTLEVRSPIWVSSVLSGMKKAADTAGGSERLQLVGFVDGAVVYLEDTLDDQEDQFNLLSVGLGFRAAITRYTQFKFDWGFPLEETALSDSGGRGHFSFEIQM